MQMAIISVPTLSNKESITNGSLTSALIVKAFKKATFIPNNATNGDIIKALFPKIDDNFSNVLDLKLWWNAPYRAESEVQDADRDKDSK